MKFALYWAQLPDQKAKTVLARKVGTVPIYLHQIATGFRSPSPAMARKIHAATDGQVSLAELRPDVYGGIA